MGTYRVREPLPTAGTAPGYGGNSHAASERRGRGLPASVEATSHFTNASSFLKGPFLLLSRSGKD